MADAFSLRWKLDQPFVLHDRPDDVHALVTIEPNTALQASPSGATALPAHLIVLVDVSASMDYLIRPDPNAKVLGQVLTDGRASRSVVSQGPSRREVACAVVEQLAGRLSGDDRLTLVAFDDQAHVLLNAAPPTAAAQVQDAVKRLARVGGGGTALGRGLQAVRRYLSGVEEQGRTRKLVLPTGGDGQEPNVALAEAQYVGRDHGVPIVAFGTGECKVSFLTEVAKTTLGGAFNHVRTETDAEQFFHQVVTAQKNVQATDVVLRLWLSPEVHVGELYRTRPEVLYVGDLQPDAANQVELRLEQMERGRAYEVLFRCTLPRRPADTRFRLAKATLAYRLPGAAPRTEEVEANLVVNYTADV